MKDFRITVHQDNPGQPFLSGASVSGNVIVEIEEPKSYKYISIQFLGQAYVHWKETNAHSSDEHGPSSAVHYTSSEEYVNERVTLWTCEQAPDNGRLAAGQHAFPFQFTIPTRAASSFEGSRGCIRYTLAGRVGKGPLQSDHQVQAKIPVQQVVGISDAGLLLPRHQEVRKKVFSLSSSLNEIKMTVTLPKTGVCIGEALPLQVVVENGSKRDITLRATLHQEVRYSAQGRHCHSKNTLLNVAGDNTIDSRTSHEWNPVLQIPITSVLDKNSYRIIQLSHSLKVKAIIPWSLHNLKVMVPLKLGNVLSLPQSDLFNVSPFSSKPVAHTAIPNLLPSYDEAITEKTGADSLDS